MFVVAGLRSTFNLCQGTPLSYEVVADSGARINRAFCGSCGCSLFIYPTIDNVHYFEADDVVGVAAGTLDDPNQFSPEFAVFVSRSPTWATFPADIERHP